MSTEREMRISDRDRQEAANRLKHAHDEGRLDFAEYDRRLEKAYSAVVYGDLDQLFSDLPATQAPPLVVRPEPKPPVPTREPDALASAFARLPTALKVLWTIWASVMAINVTVWVLVGPVGNGEIPYFWPMWLLVPGAVLLAVTASVQAGRRK